jgi:hypothetical protein
MELLARESIISCKVVLLLILTYKIVKGFARREQVLINIKKVLKDKCAPYIKEISN